MSFLASASAPALAAGPARPLAALFRRAAALLRRRSIRTQIFLAALVTVLPTAGALMSLSSRVEQLGAATRAVAATHETVQLTTHLAKLFSEMQLSVHAYALTGDEMFIDAYRAARGPWLQTVQWAAAALRGDAAQSRRLAQVEQDVDSFFANWEQVLAVLRPGGGDQTAWMRIGEDVRRMERTSNVIRALVEHEEADIRKRLQEVDRARHRARVGVGSATASAIGMLAVLTIVLGRSIARPIARTVEAAHRLGQGDWDQHVPVEGVRETQVLAGAFNQMAAKLRDAQATLAERNSELEEIAARLAAANEGLVEQQRETDDFLYVLSHDLRAPLINIQGFGKRLQASMTALETSLADGNKRDEPARLLGRMAESLKFVNLSTAKIDQLITRLLEVARLTTQPSQHQWIDTERMVHDIAGACRYQLEERGIEIDIGNLPRVFAHPVQLNQVFTNLIDNAIKYMGDRPTKRITVRGATVGDRVRFAVQDTGPGIAPKDQEKVFRMFTRLAPNASPGEGIGLAAVRTIVNRHGGRMWVESAVDVGSTFYFTLPAHPAGAAEHAPAEGDTGTERERR